MLLAQHDGEAALSRWFSESRSHAVYLSVKQELAAVFRDADSLSLPSALLISRLNLGAARGLRPAVLAAGMREELARLKVALEVIDRVSRNESGKSFLREAKRAELLNTISIYLGGGLSSSLLTSFLTASAESGRPLDDVFRACVVILKVERLGDFTEQELLSFGVSLVNSAIRPSGYAAVGSFIARAFASGRGGSSLLAVVAQILRQGGGLPQMELELGRRR